MVINIELKVPYDKEVRDKYPWQEAAISVHHLLKETLLGPHCFISSFDHDILRQVESLSLQNDYKIRTIYLHNFYPSFSLPPLEKLTSQGDGVNIEYAHLTKERVDACHAKGKIISVWIDCSVTTETVEMYKRLIDLKIDSFCSDWPCEVREMQEKLIAFPDDLESL